MRKLKPTNIKCPECKSATEEIYYYSGIIRNQCVKCGLMFDPYQGKYYKINNKNMSKNKNRGTYYVYLDEVVKSPMLCDHDFRYSHIEYPSTGTYSAIPPQKEVVVCRKCGEIRKSIFYNY